MRRGGQINQRSADGTARRLPAPGLLLGVLLLTGSTCAPVAFAGPVVTELQPVERQAIKLDLRGLPSWAQVTDDLRLELATQREYRRLEPATCQRLAAKASLRANLIARERRIQQSLAAFLDRKHIPGDSSIAHTRDRLLRILEEQERRNSALDALEAYTRLAEMETLRDLSRSLLEVQDGLISSADRAEALGLAVERREELMVQRTQTFEQAIEVLSAIRSLNSQLRELCQLAPGDWDIWPSVLETPLQDREREEWSSSGAMSVGAMLAEHPELRYLAEAEATFQPDMLPVVRDLLGRLDPMLGSTRIGPPGHGIAAFAAMAVGSRIEGIDYCERRIQLTLLRQFRERTLAAELELARASLHAEARALALRADIVRTKQEQFEDTRRRVEEKLIPTEQLELARIELLEAQVGVVRQLAELRLADLRLWRARGKLPY